MSFRNVASGSLLAALALGAIIAFAPPSKPGAAAHSLDLVRALRAPLAPPGARRRLQRGTIVPAEAILLRLLFSQTESLAKLAATREAQHLDASEARSYFAQHAGVSMGQNGAVFAVADDYYGRVQQHDRNAQHEIEQFRADHRRQGMLLDVPAGLN